MIFSIADHIDQIKAGTKTHNLIRRENPHSNMPYKDPEVAKQKKREYYHKNKEKILEKRKKYYEENKEKIAKRRKETRDYKEIYRKRRESFLIDHKKYYLSEKGKATRRKRDRLKYHNDEEFRLKKKARDIARRIPLKESCEICGSTENLEHHHPDYSKPREVQTLCIICHGKIHSIERRLP